MNLPDDIMTSALDALTDDGDRFELPDGRSLRLHIEHDPDTSINDYGCYGRTDATATVTWTARSNGPLTWTARRARSKSIRATGFGGNRTTT